MASFFRKKNSLQDSWLQEHWNFGLVWFLNYFQHFAFNFTILLFFINVNRDGPSWTLKFTYNVGNIITINHVEQTTFFI